MIIVADGDRPNYCEHNGKNYNHGQEWVKITKKINFIFFILDFSPLYNALRRTEHR